jgi:hypothetical protein
MRDNARILATGRRLVWLDKVNFAAILALVEPLAVTVRGLAEWEADGWIGDAGAAMLLKIGEQWPALQAALADAGLADRNTAWPIKDPQQVEAARCLRDLACDMRRGHLGSYWQLVGQTGESLVFAEERTADLTPAVLAKRLGVAVDLLREVVRPGTDPATPAAEPPAAKLTAVEEAIALFLRDPDLSVSEIARQVGCNRSMLYRDERFKRLRETYRGRLPKGSKSKEGHLEAELEEEDER